MLARCNNPNTILEEVTECDFDSVHIGSSDGRGVFLTRDSITTDEVKEYVRRAFSEYEGDIEVRVWKKKEGQSKGRRYMVQANGRKNNGDTPMGAFNQGGVTVAQLLDVYNKLQDERIARVTAELKGEKGNDTAMYVKEGVMMLKHIFKMGTDQMAAEKATNGAPNAAAEATDDGEQDAADEFYEVESDADRIIAYLVKLKREAPATYAELKNNIAL